EVAVNFAVVFLGPHHRDVGDRSVRDPELRAVEDIAVAQASGPRLHGAGIRAVIGFGEAEAAHLLAARHRRKPLLLLRVRAVAVDRVHHEPALYRRRRAKPGVTPLELLHDESVGDVVEARAAVALERRAEHAELAELRDERDRKRARPVMLA